MEEEGAAQVDALIYCLGGDAEDILAAATLTEEDKVDFEKVLEVFQNHCIGKRNVIYERARFHQRKQEPGETVEAFVTALHRLVAHCGYGALKEELVRDRLVVGLQDGKLSETLQTDPELTLEKALQKARQKEAVRRQQAVVRQENPAEELSVDALRKTSSKGRSSSGDQTNETAGWKSPLHGCGKCGGQSFHEKSNCPASTSKCHSCGKKGHWQKMCYKKTLREVTTEKNEPLLERWSLGALKEGSSASAWRKELSVNGKPITFKIDTGADVNAVPLRAVRDVSAVRPTAVKLYGAGGQPLEVLGKVQATLSCGNNSVRDEMYVIQGLEEPLLGRRASTGLKIVQLLQAVTADPGAKYKEKFPGMFKGLGEMKGDYLIKLEAGASPVSVNTSRRVPLALLDKVKAQLTEMEKDGIIRKVVEPTPWCSAMVVIPKSSGEVRICVDLTNLNKCIEREKLVLPSVEETLGRLAGAKVFSKLDAKAGFWQVKLAEDSQLLTTFITPFGRFCFQRLPFGISSAPEHFQRRMNQVLEAIPGVLCHMDDILITGRDLKEHDERLEEVLSRLNAAGITLNDKCEFAKTSLKFLGHILSAEGIQPDPERVKAIMDFRAPDTVTKVRQFIGMANQVGRFIPNLSEKLKPIRDLLRKDAEWNWDAQQQGAFDQVKRDITEATTLTLYDPRQQLIVSADASAYGLGAVLLQKDRQGLVSPVAFASKGLSETEGRYAQIEKEAYAVTWACERFEKFLIGTKFHVQTDHKPLIALLGDRELNTIPARIQRFKLRLMRFCYSIEHVPGKDLWTADALSRSPVEPPEKMEEELEAYVQLVTSFLPATSHYLDEIRTAQSQDPVCCKLREYCAKGWPHKTDIPPEIAPYFRNKDSLTVQSDLLVKDNRLVIPKLLREKVLCQLHAGHQGVSKCRERARMSVWWPGLSTQLQEVVTNCTSCIQERIPKVEPMIASELPDYPWQRVAADLFELNGKHYLVVVDYYSRFIEVCLLKQTTSEAIVADLKSVFARHGIPEVFRSDNGPQFASKSFDEFTRKYQIRHIKSSPHYPKSNGEAERMVKVAKDILKKAEDPELALLIYRTTPGPCGYSPTQLLMGRQLRTTLPMLPSMLTPKMPNHADFRRKDKEEKRRQAQGYNQRHGVSCHKEPSIGGSVWVRDPGTPGQIVRKTNNPRSFVVETPSRQLVRNTYHLVPAQTPRKSAQTGYNGDEETICEQVINPGENVQTPCVKDKEPTSEQVLDPEGGPPMALGPEESTPTSEQVLDPEGGPAPALAPEESVVDSGTREEEPYTLTRAGRRIIQPQRFRN